MSHRKISSSVYARYIDGVYLVFSFKNKSKINNLLLLTVILTPCIALFAQQDFYPKEKVEKHFFTMGLGMELSPNPIIKNKTGTMPLNPKAGFAPKLEFNYLRRLSKSFFISLGLANSYHFEPYSRDVFYSTQGEKYSISSTDLSTIRLSIPIQIHYGILKNKNLLIVKSLLDPFQKILAHFR